MCVCVTDAQSASMLSLLTDARRVLRRKKVDLIPADNTEEEWVMISIYEEQGR